MLRFNIQVEHIKLNKAKKEGWERYKEKDIKVFDRINNWEEIEI